MSLNTPRITGRHVKVTESIELYIKEQFSKIYNKMNIIDSSLTFSKDRYLYKVAASCEDFHGNKVNGICEEKDLYVGIHKSILKMEKQLLKQYKKQLTEKKKQEREKVELIKEQEILTT